jgi:hypothetical protein
MTSYELNELIGRLGGLSHLLAARDIALANEAEARRAEAVRPARSYSRSCATHYGHNVHMNGCMAAPVHRR